MCLDVDVDFTLSWKPKQRVKTNVHVRQTKTKMKKRIFLRNYRKKISQSRNCSEFQKEKVDQSIFVTD